MKKLLLPLAGCALLFAACKENGPLIDFGPAAKDTAYMAPVETAQQRMVVVEEFTGVSCPPCFLAHKVLKSLDEQYPNRLVLLGIQPQGPPQSKPLEAGKYPGIATQHNNVTKDGTDLGAQIYGGLGSLPWAGIDRILEGGTTPSARLFGRDLWAPKIQSRLIVAPQANVTITSSYNAGTRQAIVKVHVAYTQAVSKPQLLNVAIMENSVVDAQEGGDTTDAIGNYVHQHVFRDMLTSAVGDAMLGGMATKQAGQVYERVFVYDVDAAWNPDNCYFAAYVTNNDGLDGEVVQGAEVHLK